MQPHSKRHLIIISNITPNVTKQNLQEICKSFGSINYIDLVKDTDYLWKATVGFTERHFAVDAAAEINGGEIDGQIVKCWAEPEVKPWSQIDKRTDGNKRMDVRKRMERVDYSKRRSFDKDRGVSKRHAPKTRYFDSKQ